MNFGVACRTWSTGCGHDTLKATCHRHRGCMLWVTKLVTGEERIPLLKDLIVWGASGHVMTEQEHWSAARQVKLKYGMKLR